MARTFDKQTQDLKVQYRRVNHRAGKFLKALGVGDQGDRLNHLRNYGYCDISLYNRTSAGGLNWIQ